MSLPSDDGASLRQAIGRRIREVRELAELSQEQLAEGAGTAASSLSRIERGVRSPSAIMVIRLARVLGVQPGALLDLDGAAVRPPPQPAGPEDELLVAWRSLDVAQQELLVRMMKAAARR